MCAPTANLGTGKVELNIETAPQQFHLMTLCDHCMPCKQKVRVQIYE
jgi:hypothetical protein